MRRVRSQQRFHDRHDAGVRLAERLKGHGLEARPDVVVCGLPRGGVPVAAEVAAALGAPLDVVVVRKLGLPWQPELAIGAVGEGGVRVVNREIARLVAPQDLERLTQAATVQVERRVGAWRGAGRRHSLQGRTVVLVDDGIATGATVRAAVAVLRAAGARSVVLAVPVAVQQVAQRLRSEVDDMICLAEPPDLGSVGSWYEDFEQVSNDEVRLLLERFRRQEVEEVVVDSSAGPLPALVSVPAGATGVVVFAHGSGSSRHSPRNQAVAGRLQRSGFATVLADLLTEPEAADRRLVFDIRLLADRVLQVTAQVGRLTGVPGLPLGYFGASTGAAAALVAAASRPQNLRAVVSRGGRPDLAAEHLPDVQVPTLLIVGGDDSHVLALNRAARRRLRCLSDLQVVPGATHLFEEQGALEQVADLAVAWFAQYLPGPQSGDRADGAHLEHNQPPGA
ncbi:MAG TPA: phosphoribosyltransferase family protein [Actinomycetales bacterium]|nr:phosphoribosyltransferase family protein [Actinomycetales bacterium]